MKNRFLLFAASLVIIGQIAVLFLMILPQSMILQNGREINLTTMPVDPRDFMRGDYVALRYAVLDSLRGCGAPQQGSNIYVRLKQDENQQWVFVGCSEQFYQNLAANEVQLHGSNAHSYRYEFGIERFYVPEGEGREIERQMRAKNDAFVVKIAVSDKGKAVIKELLYEGKSLFKTALF